MTATSLIVVGAGGHGRVVADAARAAGFRIACFADTARAGQELAGLSVMAGEPEAVARAAHEQAASVVVAIGDNRARERVQRALAAAGCVIATVVHPSAVVAPSARIGAGCMILAQALVSVDATLGDGVIVNHGVTVDHDGDIDDFVHLSPGVHLGGEVSIGRGAHLAVGVSVRNRIVIGEQSLVGVGAAVVANVPAGVVALGVPAKVARPRT